MDTYGAKIVAAAILAATRQMGAGSAASEFKMKEDFKIAMLNVCKGLAELESTPEYLKLLQPAADQPKAAQ